MKVSKVAVNTAHQKWCQDFLDEQNKTTRMIRKFIKKHATYNPFSNTQFDELLKQYEKKFLDIVIIKISRLKINS